MIAASSVFDEDDDPFEPDDVEDDPAPMFGCACENPLSVDTCCDNCIEIMKEMDMTAPAAPQIDDAALEQLEHALIDDIDGNLAIAKKLAEAGDPARAVLHTVSAAIHLGYLQGRARFMLAPHILAARERLNVGVLAVAVGAAPPRTRKRAKKEASA